MTHWQVLERYSLVLLGLGTMMSLDISIHSLTVYQNSRLLFLLLLQCFHSLQLFHSLDPLEHCNQLNEDSYNIDHVHTVIYYLPSNMVKKVLLPEPLQLVA